MTGLGTLARLLAATLIALLLAGPAAASSSAAGPEPEPGTFSITPSRQDIVGRPPLSLMATRVTNTTGQPYDVTVTPVQLTQDLTGAFTFSERPAALRDARMILRPFPARLRLAPGESRRVALEWQLLPRAKRAAYVGVIFRGQARGADGRSIPVVTRLLSVDLLRLPGAYHRQGAITALRVGQFAPGKLRVTPRVANTGDVVGVPTHGRLAIHDATGRTVYRAHWTTDVVLPGAARDVPVDLPTHLPPGHYTATAAMTFGATANARRSTRFALTAIDTLPTPAVTIESFAAHGQAGQRARVMGSIHSTGTAPAGIALTIAISRVSGGLPDAEPFATTRVRASHLPGGTHRAFAATLGPALPAGQYHAVARYSDADGVPQQITSDFTASRPRSFADRLSLFVRRHEVLLILLAAAILITVLVIVFGRRQRRLQAELRELRRRDRDAPRADLPAR